MFRDIINIIKPPLSTGVIRFKIIIMILIIFVYVANTVYITYWYAEFYNALAAMDKKLIIDSLMKFLIVGAIHVTSLSEISFLELRIGLDIRENLYNYYGLNVLNDENVKLSCQRMSEDLLKFGQLAMKLMHASIVAILTIPALLYVLLDVANLLSAIVLVIYSIFGSIISRKIAKPIIDLEYKQESIEGELRRELVDVAKSKNKFLPSITSALSNSKILLKKERVLFYFTNMYLQIAVIFPYLVMLPSYVKGLITLGVMQQIWSISNRLLHAFSFFVENRQGIVDLLSVTRRVKELSRP
jgi:ABC-type uncharacterized transport system fused permease/ATPase subunit